MHYRHFQGSVKQEYLGKSVAENTGTGKKKKTHVLQFKFCCKGKMFEVQFAIKWLIKHRNLKKCCLRRTYYALLMLVKAVINILLSLEISKVSHSNWK